MDNIFLAIYIFFKLLYIIIILDIILSWLSLIWMNFRLKFFQIILEPIYERIKNTIPTTFWIFDLTPIILILFIIIIEQIIFSISPESIVLYNSFFNNLI